MSNSRDFTPTRTFFCEFSVDALVVRVDDYDPKQRTIDIEYWTQPPWNTGAFIVDRLGGLVLDVFGGLLGWVVREVGLGVSGLLAVA